jgi:hypothetical protein
MNCYSCGDYQKKIRSDDGIWNNGQNLHIQIENLTESGLPYPTYEYDVVIEGAPKVASVEYKPVVRVSNPVLGDMIPITGESVSYEVEDIDT